MRLGEKTKKALRIGAKVGTGIALVAGGTRLGTKDPLPVATPTHFEGKDFMRTIGESRSGGGGGLVARTGELAGGASDFLAMTKQLRTG
jgi:hypothetical protein